MDIIILCGIPGVGKSSILQETAKHVPEMSIINYGDMMLEEASSKGLTRDALRKLPFKDQQEIGIFAAKRIAKQKKSGVVIVDTHALVRTNSGYCPGLPRKVLDILSPSAFVMVECKPQLILERRTKDKKRARDNETLESLTIHQDLTRSFLSACCMYTDALLCVLQNNDPNISQNAAPLVRMIEHELSKYLHRMKKMTFSYR